jgi:hypothetical protein
MRPASGLLPNKPIADRKDLFKQAAGHAEQAMIVLDDGYLYPRLSGSIHSLQ